MKKSEKNILPSGKKICMKKVIFIMKSKAFASVQKEKGGAYSIMQREGFFFLGERDRRKLGWVVTFIPSILKERRKVSKLKWM